MSRLSRLESSGREARLTRQPMEIDLDCNGEETCTPSGECVPGATNTCSIFAYDTVDRLTGVRPLGREEHGLGYDAADRGISYTPPVLSGPSGRVDLTRDPDGLVSRVDVDAGPTRSVVTSRHPDGRPQSVQHEGHTITFGYDSAAALDQLDTEDGITVSLDTDGPLLESVTWSGSAGVAGAVAFGYDELWDLSTITAGSLATSYHHDEDGALDCVAPGGTADSTCASGLLIAPNLPARTLVMSMAGAASVMSSYEWSDLGEATQTVHQWSTTGELSFTYDERDGEGRLTRVIEDDGAGGLVLQYSYDVEGRLIEVKRDGVVSESYTYDPNGQRITATRDDVPVTPIAWDARDRLTQYGGVAYEYDPAGRRTTRTEGGRTTTYTYDLLGALRAVDLPDTTNDIEYLIDGAGRRVGRKVGPIGSGALERAWIYLDDLRPIVEMDGSGTVTRIFVYGAGRAPDLIVVPAGQPDAGTYRVLTDHLDSVRRVVNAESGAVIQQLDYDAFGNVLVDTNPGWQPLGFAAGLYDPGARDPACVLAGGRYCGALVRFGARDYDPEIGQWTASDPLRFSGYDTNLYRYSHGDPVNRIDPRGTDDQMGLTSPEDLLYLSFSTVGIWQLPSNAVGVVAGVLGSGFDVGIGEENTLEFYDNAVIKYFNGGGATTFGHVICYGSSNPGADVRSHELEHVEQSNWMGPFYLPLHLVAQGASAALTKVVGAPSNRHPSARHAYSAYNPLEWGPYSSPPSPWAWPW